MAFFVGTEIHTLLSESASRNTGRAAVTSGCNSGREIISNSSVFGSKTPILSIGVSVNQIFPSLSIVNETEICPSNSNDSSCLSSRANFQIFGAVESLIQIVFFPS